ncbi:zinc finger CCHC domain-containing protein 8 isoform X2 [Gymnogyps californianus]|uniref:zinc finger CCHC domain-containing protein 8 isoform X2 n=1 Tax=Gymnogyps californianus TaxID=33616 RepID=UPI0021C6F59D|nr:zinc finger CCHC domain-containing protein 8 isoform X2 [Gymnogyps californianus]
MAAEVDFGDRELFEQLEQEDGLPPPPRLSFEEEEERPEKALEELYARLRDREETVRRLRAENQELKRKLNILTRPSGISVDNSKFDGPLLQILFMNNVISKQYHQEIEDFVFNLVQKYEEQKRGEQEKTHFNVKPQPSSVLLEEDCKTASSNSVKKIKEAFSPRNAARISEKRKEFMEACGEASNQNFQQRYHAEEVEERFGKFKPGVISGELQDALGVTDKSLPPFIYRMRQLGYPPGWLKEAEMEHSGLALYDGKDDGGTEDEGSCQPKRTTYDVSKLINYPGFNISTPSGIPDEWQIFGSIPIQPSQQKDVFANYLSDFHAPSPKSSNKRAASQSRSHHSKRPKEDNLEEPAADMDLDSDLEVSQRSQTQNNFQFQPPLPPERPSMSTPPPLPRGTPPLNFTPPQPSTPTRPPLPRTTPPLNPSSDIPQPKIVDSIMDEDTLTLEELEEQQRLIWAALEQAESTNSDSDIPVDTPLTGNSVTSSPSRNEVDLVAEVRSSDKVITVETRFSDISEQIPENERSITSPNPGDTLLNLKENPDNTDSEGLLDNTMPAPNCEVNDGENTGGNKVVTNIESSAKNSSLVPDMSKFAAGITPFEFENMAESTGVYLRIRSVLKNSPRNQQKKKTSS